MSTLTARFENKYIPEPMSGCWIWLGSGERYGQIGGHDTRILMTAHRVSWEIYRGAIPVGINVLHSCDNTFCVNPDHLFLGTQADNIADMVAKGRHRLHRGYPTNTQKLTIAQTIEIRTAKGRHIDIATQFDITRSRVSQIKRGE